MWDAESISLAESMMISAMTASTPYWGRPISVVIEMALAETALELSTVLEVVALVVAIEMALAETALELSTVLVVVALVVNIVLEVMLVSKIHPAR